MKAEKKVEGALEYRKFQMSCAGRGIVCSLGAERYGALCAQPCAYCGKLRNARTVTRLDNEEGFTVGNSEAICRICFSAKGDFSRKLFLGLVKQISEFCVSSTAYLPKKEKAENVKARKPISEKSNLGSSVGRAREETLDEEFPVFEDDDDDSPEVVVDYSEGDRVMLPYDKWEK